MVRNIRKRMDARGGSQGMRARTWGIVILANVVITSAVILGALLLWNYFTSPAEPPATASVPAAFEGAQASGPPAEVSTAAPDLAVVPAPPAKPGEYVVEPGDTLTAIAREYGVTVEELMVANGLADPNVLSVGQILIIPVGGEGPAEVAQSEVTPGPQGPSATPLPTPTSVGPPIVEIAEVLGTGDLTQEVLTVSNRGGSANLDKWMLADAEGNVFIFPPLTLFPNAQVRIHTGQGTNGPTALYWGRLSPAWAAGERITLRDAAGVVIDTYIVP
jgi:LysM repeat protein